MVFPRIQRKSMKEDVSCAFRTGKIRQDHVDLLVNEVVVGIGLEVDVREQQGWVNHEKGEGEIEKYDTPFWGHLTHTCVRTCMQMCECAQTNCATEKCACDK